MNAGTVILPGLFLLGMFFLVFYVLRMTFLSEQEDRQQRWTPPGGTVLVRQDRYAAMAALAEEIYELLGDLENPSAPDVLEEWDRRVERIRRQVGRARAREEPRRNT